MKYLFLFRLFLALYTFSNFILSLQVTKETITCTSYKNKKKCNANRDCTWMTKCQLKLPVDIVEKIDDNQTTTKNTNGALASSSKKKPMASMMIIQ